MQSLRRTSQSDNKFFVESHRKSKCKLATNKSQGKQTFLRLDQINFKEKAVFLFLAADIPLHKLNHPSLKSNARASVAKLAYKKEQIRELLMKQRLLNKSILMCWWAAWIHQMTHSSLISFHLKAVATLIAILFCTLWMTYLRQLETKRENFALLLTDAARYMSLAGKTLKKLYLFLMHVTCVAHLLHNCAMRVRAYFKNIDKVVAMIKTATIKNKDRKNDFMKLVCHHLLTL